MPLAALAWSGCIREVGRGPDLGPCAEPPAGNYTYGEIGIGRCLAGPTDVRFVEQDGQTWLAVTNADPYLSFTSGSLLMIDFSSIDLSTGRNPISEVEAYAVPTDRFVGGLAWLPERALMLVAGRLSEDSLVTSDPDELFVFDVSDPTAPASWAEGGSLTVGADPQPIVIDEAVDRAYVVNLTDHTISVVDTSASPLEIVSPGPDASVSDGSFFDAIAPIGEPLPASSAAFEGGTLLDLEDVRTERWDLTWVDGTYRLWIPQQGGLSRWTTGGDGVVDSSLGLEADPLDVGLTSFDDPFVGFVEGLLTLYVSNEGVVLRLIWDPTTASWFEYGVGVALEGESAFDAWIGATTVLSVNDVATAFYEARESAGAPPVIGVATSSDGQRFTPADEPLLVAPEGYLGIGDPFVREDALTGSLRMWASLWDGTRWTIGHTESFDDGATWSVVEPITGIEGEQVAAPAVTWLNGRYVMWGTRSVDETWVHFSAWSWDGLEWTDANDVIPSGVAFDLTNPPRPALQADATGAWRLTGADIGWTRDYVTAGPPFVVADAGFAVEVTYGSEIGGVLLGEIGENGVEPGSYAEIDGVPTLYATTTDDDLRQHVSILQWSDAAADWVVVVEDAIAAGTGGNVAGAGWPVIWGEPGDWSLFYAATGTDGAQRARRATSTDGLSFTPVEGAVIPSDESWDAVAQLPHSVEPLEDGRIRLWYTGGNGSRFRIGAAVGTVADLEPDLSGADPWQFGTGQPGEFDDSGVRDPMVVVADGITHLWYAGNDGLTWRIGHAVRDEAGVWVRRTDPVTHEAVPALQPTVGFASAGVYAPVVIADGDGFTAWYAGVDGTEPQVGRAIGDATHLLPAARFPTPGDRLVFTTTAGHEEREAIELTQIVDGFATSGEGLASAALDEERGFLYLPSKKTNYLYVIDVRDDSTGAFQDLNYLDVEAILVVTTTTGPRGFRDVEIVPGTDLLYATSWGPDALVVVDLSVLEDDDLKQAYTTSAVAALPLARGAEDAGVPSYVGLGGADQLSGADMALSGDGRTLFVPNYLDNSVEVFDLGLGAYGQEIHRIRYIGEAPHLIRFSPDGRFAVVANYVGEIDEGVAQSTLAVIDTDPASPTYLEVLTWLTND